MDLVLVRRDVNGLNWNEILRSPCPVSTLNEALLRVLRNRVPKQTVVVRTVDKPWFDDPCALAHRAKHSAYRVWCCSRIQADWEEYRVALRYAQHEYVEAERAFNGRSKALLTNSLNPPKW